MTERNVGGGRRPAGGAAIGVLVFLALLVVYGVTLAPNVSFWDSGEFIASSYILGVPHPPGTPLYVLIGRLFSLLPGIPVAVRINLLSAVPGALAGLFLYLSLLRVGAPLIRPGGGVRRLGAASGALFAGLGATCWTNATEAEVYALSLFVVSFCLWLLLRWGAGETKEIGRRPLVLIGYILSLSIGVHLGTYLALPAFTLFVLVVDRRALTDTKFLAFLGFLTLFGLTVHFYLPIRSTLNPAIDEANPETRRALLDFLLRKQYKPNNPLVRQAPWAIQFDMFWRYFRGQYGGALPLLGVVGGWLHFRRDRRTFLLYALLFLISSVFLVFYMNFTANEVRDRDYFFAPSFFFWGGWMGIGLAVLVGALRQGARAVGVPERAGALAAGVLLLALPASIGAMRFDSHDRRGNYIAHDYAWNILTSLERDAILFTNGDNDTFPLWYLQEVEGVRTDVRVVNLALLNTRWYIWQLKHLGPKVPFSYSDEEIDRLEGYRTRSGEVYYLKDLAARDIVRANGWRRPIYFCVTVADLMGLDEEKRLSLEGLVFRLTKEKQKQIVNLEKCEENLWKKYRYRGILDEQNHLDEKVARNENQKKLITNYSAALSRLAVENRKRGNREEAIRALEMAGRISPGYRVYEALMGPLYVEAERYDEAEAIFARQLQETPESLPPYLGLAYIREVQGRPDEAESLYARGIEVAPRKREGYQRLCRLLIGRGELEPARRVLLDWLKIDPADDMAMNQLVEVERVLVLRNEGEGSPDP